MSSEMAKDTLLLSQWLLLLLIGCAVSHVTSSPVFKQPEHLQQKRSEDMYSCYENNVQYKHGDIFRGSGPVLECITFRCEYGHRKVYEGGCSYNGQCVREGATTQTQECKVNRCDFHFDGSTFSTRMTIVQTMCVDDRGRCVQRGERFSAWKDGYYHRNSCTCLGNGHAYCTRQ